MAKPTSPTVISDAAFAGFVKIGKEQRRQLAQETRSILQTGVFPETPPDTLFALLSAAETIADGRLRERTVKTVARVLPTLAVNKPALAADILDTLRAVHGEQYGAVIEEAARTLPATPNPTP